MSNSSSTARVSLWSIVVVVLALAALTLLFRNRDTISQLTTAHPTLPSRRGDTVQNLRGIKTALRQYQQTHGRLPNALEHLGLSTEVLRDGAGRPFVYTHRYIEKGYLPGQGEFLIVAMSEPTGHFPLDPRTRSYAIVRTKDGEFFIRSSSDPERLQP